MARSRTAGKRWMKTRKRRLARRRGYGKVYRSFKLDCAGVVVSTD